MGAFSKLQAYFFLVKLVKPFDKWDAFKLGLIDNTGKLIKRPVTFQEKDSLDTFDNLVRKIKIIIQKFAPSLNYLSFMTAAYLLKTEDIQYNIFKDRINKVCTNEELEEVMVYLQILRS